MEEQDKMKDFMNAYDLVDRKHIVDMGNLEFHQIRHIREVTYEYPEGKKIRYIATYKGAEIIIPKSVMNELKLIWDKYKDKITTFSVDRFGEGKNTRYKVIPKLDQISQETVTIVNPGFVENGV